MVDPDEMFVWTFCGDEGHGILYGPYRDRVHADEEAAIAMTVCDHHHAHWSASPRMVAASFVRHRGDLVVDRWSVYRRMTDADDGRFLAYAITGVIREAEDVFEAIGAAYEELRCSAG